RPRPRIGLRTLSRTRTRDDDEDETSFMARNRKNQSGAVRFVPALKAVLLCTLIGGSAVGYVLQKNKLHELGRQIKKREVMLERVKWEKKLMDAQLGNVQIPQHLVERV